MGQNIFQSKNSKVNPYTSLIEIDSVLFHKVKFNGDHRLLDKNNVDEKVLDYNETDLDELKMAWYSLYDEYFNRVDDGKFKMDLKKKKKSVILLLQIKKIQEIQDLMKVLESDKKYLPNEVVKDAVKSFAISLKKIHTNINLKSSYSLKRNINIVENVKGGLETKYKILFKEEEDEKENDLQLYYDVVADIELTLDRSMPIKMNMLQYISYEKQYKEKIKQLNSKQNN